MPSYAVTGASGHLGRLAVAELQARGVPGSDVVAVVRSRDKAADLADRGVLVREADYSRPGTLVAALAGVERLLLVSSSWAGQRVAHHVNVIQAAKAAGASRVVYTSMLNAGGSASPLAGEHRDTERALRDAGMPFILLRNGWYTENYTDQIGQYLQAGEIVGAAGPAGSPRPPGGTMPPPRLRRSLKTRQGTGPTSSAARPSTCPSLRGPSPASPAHL